MVAALSCGDNRVSGMRSKDMSYQGVPAGRGHDQAMIVDGPSQAERETRSRRSVDGHLTTTPLSGGGIFMHDDSWASERRHATV